MSSGPSRSSRDPVDDALRVAAAALLDAVGRVGSPAPRVLVDGRSGAGKSTLARLLVRGWPGPVQLVALDALYPGWDGLDAGTAIAREHVLEPHTDGRIGIWRRWDWAAGCPAEARAVVPELPVIVEGSGIVTPQTASLAHVSVWLRSPEPSRRRRALDRDGEGFRPHWERWARQEDVHERRDEPERLATHVFDVP